MRDYEEEVKGPGKFEGENRYVPYFWLDQYPDEQVMNGGLCVFIYNVNVLDKQKFPELRKRKRVKLYERSDGFVIEA